MTSRLAGILGISASGQQSLAKASGRLLTVAEFLIDVIKATEKVDFLKELVKCTPWWLQVVGKSAAEAAPPIMFLSTLIAKLGDIKDPDRLAYLAFTTAYQRAVEKALLTVGAPAAESAVASEWTPSCDIQTPQEGMSFDNYSTMDPFNHPFLQQATALLTEGTKSAGYNSSEVRKIQNEVLMRFPGCLNSLVTHPTTREKYLAFAESLRHGHTENRVNAAWLDHFEYLRYEFEDKCVFGEEPFSLSDIYIDVECGVLAFQELLEAPQETTESCDSRYRFASGRTKTDAFHEGCGGRHDLLTSVMRLIGDKSFRDAIVVQGPAGSGKSVFTLRLAMELLRAGLKPIRIRFRDIPLKSMSIEDALPEAVRFWDLDQRAGDLPTARPDELFLGMALFDQTVKYGEADICPYVLILDGWDEVSVAAQKGFAVRIAEILAQVRDRFLNRGNRPVIRIILTGRPSTAISSSSFLTKQTRLLTIRPLEPSMLQRFVEGLAKRLTDPQKADSAGPERFSSVLSKYREEFKVRLDDRHSVRNGPETMEVFGIPLLTHLAVRLMVRWPGVDLSPLVENPTTLYRQLTNLTCEKGGRYGSGVYDPGIQGRELRELLHETAAAMTVFGRDSIPYEELDTRLSRMNEDLLDRVQEVTKDHPVTSMMINFFFKGGRTELGAEFLHKSFREFLFAEAIVETLKNYGLSSPHYLEEQSGERYGLDFREDDPRYAFSRRLGSLIGPQWLTKEVCVFIEGLLRWELARSHGSELETSLGISTVGLPLPDWQKVADGLADLWNWWGEGVHLRIQPKYLGKKVAEWAEPFVNHIVKWALPQELPKGEAATAPRTTSIDAHLGDGIFRLSALVHHYLAVKPGDQSRWQVPKNAPKNAPVVRRYQVRGMRDGKWAVRFAPSGTDPSYFSNYSARINAAGWHPDIFFPCGLFMESVDLTGCLLDVTGFIHCRLGGASLSGASLVGALFIASDLTDCDLMNAKIHRATFLDCRMHNVRIEGLQGTHPVLDQIQPETMAMAIMESCSSGPRPRRYRTKIQC